MGEPIKVGDSFNTYEGLGKYIRANYWDYKNGMCQGHVNLFNFNSDAHVYAQGRKYGKNAEIFIDWKNGTESIYSTEYKPKSVRTDGIKSYDVAFTTIYDYGYDQNGSRYNIKAIDINGNGVIDEGEMTYYDSFDDMVSE